MPQKTSKDLYLAYIFERNCIIVCFVVVKLATGIFEYYLKIVVHHVAVHTTMLFMNYIIVVLFKEIISKDITYPINPINDELLLSLLSRLQLCNTLTIRPSIFTVLNANSPCYRDKSWTTLPYTHVDYNNNKTMLPGHTHLAQHSFYTILIFYLFYLVINE